MQIIARADELTIARLASLRAAVLLGMQSEGLSFGLLLYSSLSETQDLDLVPPLPSLESSVVEGMVNSVSAPEISRSASESNIPTVYEDRPRLVRVRSRSKSFSKARRRTLDNNDRLQLFSTLDIEESSLPFAIMGPDVLPHQSFEGISLKRIYVSLHFNTVSLLKYSLFTSDGDPLIFWMICVAISISFVRPVFQRIPM